MSMEEVEKMAYTMHCALEEVLLAEDPPIVSDSMSEVHKTRSLQVSEKTVGVKLSNLPKTLCNRSHLEVAIEQAGLESKVKAFELSSESAATAFLALESEAAAQQCIKHFSGRQWTGSATPLCARYCKDATTVHYMRCKNVSVILASNSAWRATDREIMHLRFEVSIVSSHDTILSGVEGMARFCR